VSLALRNVVLPKQPDSTWTLEGTWRVARLSGLLPPLGFVRKRIRDGRGWTIAGPVALPFDVSATSLRYRFPLRGLVDTLAPETTDPFAGTTTLFGRRLGTFRMILE